MTVDGAIFLVARAPKLTDATRISEYLEITSEHSATHYVAIDSAI